MPLYLEDAEGPRVQDVDGNEYIDYALAWGPLILGHKHPAHVAAMRRQAEQPLCYGAQHRLEIRVAETLCRLVPCAERVLFTSSGSEAVHITCRLARAATGRRRIVRFEGHYHGWFDSILWSYRPPPDALDPARPPRPAAGSKGQPENMADNLLIATWNDLSSVDALFQEHADEIAAVIVEPILCNSGGLFPEEGFLEDLRALTERHGALLVFDEVITGFRVGLGGAQEMFGVTPDLATFGKAIAGGATLSAVAGRADILELVGSGVAFGGTFNGNPVALAVAEATLAELEAEHGRALRQANDTGEQLKEGVRRAANDADLAVQVLGHGTCFWVHFTEDADLRSYRDTLGGRRDLLATYLRLMLDEGVMLLPEGRIYVSAVHREAEVQQTLEAFRTVFRRLAQTDAPALSL